MINFLKAADLDTCLIFPKLTLKPALSQILLAKPIWFDFQ